MNAAASETLTIVGAGPVGTLLALLLARQGLRSRLYERRPDPRSAPEERGRSINLALAARGIEPLRAAGVFAAVSREMVKMPGRCLHDEHGHTRFMAYGQNEGEVIYAISRARLNRLLVEAAAYEPLIELHFRQRCVDADPDRGTLQLHDELSGGQHSIEVGTVFGADGAGSGLRRALAQRGRLSDRDEALLHDYKELAIAATAAGGFAMDAQALHIWPRGGHMLIALPNCDGSFTATLFLPRTGPVSFAALNEPGALRSFFAEQFPDALALLPDLEQQFTAHPQSQLATLHCWPWVAGRMLLLGDAAHAIVPFHGQGLNCGFEDCAELVELIARHGSGADTLQRFERERRGNTDAIAQMALENYVEMRDGVRTADFALRKQLGLELEQRFPGRFIPRYSMVMFHAEIPYVEALRRGAVQERLIDVLVTRGLLPIAAHTAVIDELLAETNL
ncbi:MAG: NAD(P)/FAD-dependent oxidoreductase [Steroidobacteraceae bacterium]